MQKSLQIGKTQWIFIQTPDKETIDKLSQEYDFHEMIVSDILGVNGQSKIDTSSNHFFLELTFTKYETKEERYISNELDVIIRENTIITTIGVESESFNKTFEDISKEAEKIDKSYKSSPYYILYRIINEFYDKTIKSLAFA